MISMNRFGQVEEPDPSEIAEGKDWVITLKEAAEILGVSYPTVNRMVHSGELFAFRVKNGWRTRTAVCRQYLAQQMSRQLASWNRKGLE